MIHVGDNTWNLRVLITDLQVEKTLRVKGDLHIGGVMLKLSKTEALSKWLKNKTVKMVLKLYYLSASPPSRAVLLGIRNLGLEVDVVTVNLFKGEHLKQEFKNLNPVHQVPVIDDNGFVLSESRAILGYLVNKFQPGSTLYPADVKKRAIIDQRMYYDTNVFERNAAAIRPIFREPNPPRPSEITKAKIRESMEILDGFVSKSLWFAGDLPTIADFSILSNVAQIKACGYKISRHENLNRWYEICKSLPGFEENEKGAIKLGDVYQSRIGNPFETY